MSANKDTKTGKWTSQFYYTDWKGQRKKKFKRGFDTKREALEWEREFLCSAQADMNMSFSAFAKIYFDDMKHRLRESTFTNKQYIIDLKIIPYFGQLPICEIKAAHVRKWQNELMSYRDENGNPYSQTYLKLINNQLTAIFNYAVKYYDLKENPCHKAGGMGKNSAGEAQFWTAQEFETFIAHVDSNSQAYAAFLTLYYTGMRIGELMALTPADVDMENEIIIINKSYQRLKGKDIITPPKTPKSNRTVTIPTFLRDCLKECIATQYVENPDNRIFSFAKGFLAYELKCICKQANIKRIRIHDIRHSHASLLIEMGFGPLLIAERLGHEKVETTLETYSHLYPNKQTKVSAKLQSLYMKSDELEANMG